MLFGRFDPPESCSCSYSCFARAAASRNSLTSETTLVIPLDHCDLTSLIDGGAEIRSMEAGDARRRAPTKQRHRPAVSTSDDG